MILSHILHAMSWTLSVSPSSAASVGAYVQVLAAHGVTLPPPAPPAAPPVAAAAPEAAAAPAAQPAEGAAAAGTLPEGKCKFAVSWMKGAMIRVACDWRMLYNRQCISAGSSVLCKIVLQINCVLRSSVTLCCSNQLQSLPKLLGKSGNLVGRDCKAFAVKQAM